MTFLRPESSVSRAYNEWGEEIFVGDRPGPVIHRTPEELGIPRVAPADPPRRKDVRPDHTAYAYRERVAKDKPRTLARAVAVRLDAEVEAKISGPKNAPQKVLMQVGEEKGMPTGQYAGPANELRAKVLAEPDASVAELIEKYGVSKVQVYDWRYQARKEAGVVKRAPGSRRQPAKPVSLARTIEVDPQRPGTAAALIGALAKHDAAVRIELTHGEVAELLRRLTTEQQATFLAAGLKAALLG